MGARHWVADVDDLPDEGSRVFAEINGVEIAVFRIGEDFHALANYCVHQGGPLCEGELRGRYAMADDGWEWTFDTQEKNVMCPWHGWKFDVTTGENINDERYTTPTFDVEVEDGSVYVIR